MSGRRVFRSWAPILLSTLLLSTISVGQGTLGGNRDLMRRMAEGVADVIEKNFYDPSLKGVDMKKLLAETKAKIDSCTTPTEMNAAIYEMVRKMDDSHTNFIPPRLTLVPKFEFKAKPYGDKVRVYWMKEKGVAVNAGLKLGDTIVAIEGVPATREKYMDTNFYYRFIQPVSPMILDLRRDSKLQRLPIPANLHIGHAIDYVYDYSRVFDWERESETEYAEDPFQYGNYDGIGYVKVRNFVSSLGEKALWKVKNSSALVVDLRSNPGGEIDELERFAGYFDTNATEIGQAAGRKKSEKVMSKPQNPSFSGIPIVILVDSDSASASEIFARYM